MDDNVKVKIFGQEYIISGDKDKEEIERVAEYVDNKMHLIARVTDKRGTGVIAVLTAVNITDEYFEAMDQIEQLKTANAQLEADSKRYLKNLEEFQSDSTKDKTQIDEMTNKIKEQTSKYDELEKKCTEYENSIFDLQMENIQLKSELDKKNKDQQ
jgi:cell division protein ZapA